MAICFGGQLIRGNRAQKVTTSSYRAFDSVTYPKLAVLGVDVDWQLKYLLQVGHGAVVKQWARAVDSLLRGVIQHLAGTAPRWTSSFMAKPFA